MLIVGEKILEIWAESGGFAESVIEPVNPAMAVSPELVCIAPVTVNVRDALIYAQGIGSTELKYTYELGGISSPAKSPALAKSTRISDPDFQPFPIYPVSFIWATEQSFTGDNVMEQIKGKFLLLAPNLPPRKGRAGDVHYGKFQSPCTPTCADTLMTEQYVELLRPREWCIDRIEREVELNTHH